MVDDTSSIAEVSAFVPVVFMATPCANDDCVPIKNAENKKSGNNTHLHARWSISEITLHFFFFCALLFHNIQVELLLVLWLCLSHEYYKYPKSVNL